MQGEGEGKSRGEGESKSWGEGGGEVGDRRSPLVCETSQLRPLPVCGRSEGRVIPGSTGHIVHATALHAASRRRATLWSSGTGSWVVEVATIV